MFGLFEPKDTSLICSPVTGTVHPLCECRDAAFSGGALGDGVIFRFDGDYIVAPCSGKVGSVAKTNHCVSIFCDNGAELLIHCGFDTMMLKPNGLRILVSKNQRVRQGQKLIEIDREVLKGKDVDLTTPMVIMNADDVNFEIVCTSGEVKAKKTAVMRCQPKEEV